MRLVTLDSIICKILIDRGYPNHFYLQFLSYAIDCLKEIHQRHMAFNVIPVKLSLDSNKSAQLPDDFEADVRVGYLDGQRVSTMTEDNSITPLYNRNAEGEAVPHGTTGDYSKAGDVWRIDTNGNDLGGSFGATYGPSWNKYKIFREQNRIQASEDYPFDYIYMEYVTDGMEFDNATMTLQIFERAIKAFVIWQMKESNRNYGLQERQLAKSDYDNEVRIIRANNANWSIEDVYEILRSANYLKY